MHKNRHHDEERSDEEFEVVKEKQRFTVPSARGGKPAGLSQRGAPAQKVNQAPQRQQQKINNEVVKPKGNEEFIPDWTRGTAIKEDKEAAVVPKTKKAEDKKESQPAAQPKPIENKPK